MSNWGSFSEQSYEDFMDRLQNPVDYMVVAPALASRAAKAPETFMMDEEGEEEEDWDWEDEEEEEEPESNAKMAMGQLRSMAEDIALILGELSYDDHLEPWVAAKITMSKQNLSAVADYLRFGDDYSESLDFTRCQKPNGKIYGTRGKCKKGREVAAKAETPKNINETILAIEEHPVLRKYYKTGASWDDLHAEVPLAELKKHLGVGPKELKSIIDNTDDYEGTVDIDKGKAKFYGGA